MFAKSGLGKKKFHQDGFLILMIKNFTTEIKIWSK